MGKRFFWFVVGVSVTALVVVKGREYYHRFTPAGVTEQLEQTGRDVRGWVGDFLETFSEARADREAELREALGLDEATEPVQGTAH